MCVPGGIASRSLSAESASSPGSAPAALPPSLPQNNTTNNNKKRYLPLFLFYVCPREESPLGRFLLKAPQVLAQRQPHFRLRFLKTILRIITKRGIYPLLVLCVSPGGIASRSLSAESASSPGSAPAALPPSLPQNNTTNNNKKRYLPSSCFMCVPGRNRTPISGFEDRYSIR